MRDRLIRAGAVLLLGIAFCSAMYGWQQHYAYAAHGFGINFFAAIPFVGLAVLVVCGLGRIGTVVAWTVLATVTGGAYVAAATSPNSTAVLVFGVPYFFLAVAAFVIFPADTLVRAWKTWRQP